MESKNRRWQLGTFFIAALLACPAQAGELNTDVADDVFYQFMPIAWRDSNNDAWRYGDFGGMTDSLEYLEYLGVTAVWMTPIFPSPAYHGYQHGPPDTLNPWFGDEPQFLNVVAQAHARGIKVFIDFVAYGINQNSVFFQSAFRNPASPYDTWLAFNDAGNQTYQGYSFATWSGATVGFVHWDLRTVAARDYVISCAQHWLDPNGDGDPGDGIDGYRLDHVWLQYGSGPDGWGYNLDDFWTPWKAALETVKPGVFIFCEQADWGLYGQQFCPPFDAAFTKPFEFAARDALAAENAGGLYSAMAATLANRPADGTFLTILADHDVDRLASVIGDSPAKGKAAAAVLLLQPLPPVIYFGDEIGMRGRKNNALSGDAKDIPMREPFKWNAVAGPPMSNYFGLNGPAFGQRYSRDNDGRSVQEQRGVAGSLLETYRQLIALRHSQAALRHGEYTALPASSSRVWAFMRHTDHDHLLVAINVSGQAVATQVNLARDFAITAPGAVPLDLLSGAALPMLDAASLGAYPLSLQPYQSIVARVPAAAAVPLDGLAIPTDHGAGALVATQTDPAFEADNLLELDQLYADAQPSGLRIGLTGNLAGNGSAIALFIDLAPGGQNTLNLTGVGAPPPGGLGDLTGLRFDAGFEPELLYYANVYDDVLYVDHVALGDGGATKTYRGNSSTSEPAGGALAGGTNPFGVRAAMDLSNAAGVTAVSAASAASATAGLELFIPWGELGLPANPGGFVRLAAGIVLPDGRVTGQWLPGLSANLAIVGPAPDLRAFDGDQHAAFWLRQAGDLNCDGLTNNFDIGPFVLALIDPPGYAAAFPACARRNADIDNDAAVTNFDIDPFVNLLLQP